MNRVFVIGSSTLDLFFQDPSLTYKRDRFLLAIGGKYVVNTFYEGVGGGGANVAVGLSRLGHSCVLWSEIGKDSLTKLIRERLESEKVDCSLLEHKEKNINISAILLSPNGERTIINHRSHEAQMKLNNEVKRKLSESNLLYLGNMPEMPLAERVEIANSVKDNGGTVALNLGVHDCRRGYRELSPLLTYADYVLVNRYELADLVDSPPNELLLTEKSYSETIGLNMTSTLIITDGSLGSYAHTGGKIYFQEAEKVDAVVDTTGAGDAYTAGFLSMLLEEKSIQEALSFASQNSASVIRKVGAQEGLLRK